MVLGKLLTNQQPLSPVCGLKPGPFPNEQEDAHECAGKTTQPV